MQTALVIGTATSTVKHHSMNGQKLLIVQPRLLSGKPDGDPLVAIDAIGAGAGDNVMISSDGRFVRDKLKVDATPVRWSVVGTAE